MILRVGSLFIQHLNRLPIQLREFTLEANPVDTRKLVSVIILYEKRKTICVAELRSSHREVLDLVCLRDRKGLGRLQVACGRKVEVISVSVDLKGLRTGTGRGGTDKDGVEL